MFMDWTKNKNQYLTGHHTQVPLCTKEWQKIVKKNLVANHHIKPTYCSSHEYHNATFQ